MVTPGAKRDAVVHAQAAFGVSERRACEVVGIARRVQRYVSRWPDDLHLRTRLRALTAERRRFGYRRLGYLLAREGLRPNHKKLLRIYREERLKVRRRSGRKRALGTRAPLVVPQGPNQCWALDFVSDALVCGRRFRILAVFDQFSRECVALVADTSLSGARVARELDAAITLRGRPGSNAARKRGTCTNNSSLRRSKLETMVIEALRASLMNPDDIQDFISTFTAEWNRLAAEINAERAQDKTRLATIERKIAKIIEAVMDGFRTEELKQQLETLSREKARLQARLEAPSVSAPSIHPNLAQLYRSKVAALQNEFTKSGTNNTGVLTALRDLIERVDFGPGKEGGEAEIILTGILSSMVRLGLGETPTKTTPSVGISESVPDLFTSSVKLVAGPGKQLDLLLSG